jgi:hypothetical protein
MIDIFADFWAKYGGFHPIVWLKCISNHQIDWSLEPILPSWVAENAKLGITQDVA